MSAQPAAWSSLTSGPEFPRRSRVMPAETPVAYGPHRGSAGQGSADRLDDGLVEAGERQQVFPALILDPLDHGLVFGRAALAVIQLARLQDLLVVDAGQQLGNLVPEIRVGLPPDRVLDDGLDDRR